MQNALYRACLIGIFALFGPASANAIIFFSDSGVHTVNFQQQTLGVLDSTTVNFVGFGGARGFNGFASGPRGIVTGDTAVTAIDGSTINFDGDRLIGGDGITFSGFSGLTAGGDGLSLSRSTATISGGTLQGGNVLASNDSLIRGGNALNLDDSTVVINGGTFSHGIPRRLSGTGISQDGISVRAIADSVIDLFGGVFTSEILLADSVLNVFGTDLMFHGTTLTGNLQNGGDTSIEINMLGTSQVFLFNAIEVPEPGTIAILTVGLIALRRRNRR